MFSSSSIRIWLSSRRPSRAASAPSRRSRPSTASAPAARGRCASRTTPAASPATSRPLYLRNIGNEVAAKNWRELYTDGLSRLFSTRQWIDESEDLAPDSDDADIRRPRPQYAGIG
jgi:hypothetical protein